MLFYEYLTAGFEPGVDLLELLAGPEAFVGVDLAELQAAFGGFDAVHIDPSMFGFEADDVGHHDAFDVPDGGPADGWLSGDEFHGAAEIGGTHMTSGTFDTSGAGNDVISVDGEVLDLPPY